MMNRRESISVSGMLRVVMVGLAILAQFALVVFLVYVLRSNFGLVYLAIDIAANIAVLSMVIRNQGPEYIITWLLIISFLPVFGAILYLLWGRTGASGHFNRQIKDSMAETRAQLRTLTDKSAQLALEEAYPFRKRVAGYLANKGFPVYQNTQCQYYPLGEQQFEAMLADFEDARDYIFLEYFIIGAGEVWDRMQDMLIHKAKQGVKIRILYDDMGSLAVGPKQLGKVLQEFGIEVRRFVPIHKYIFQLHINFRNHQKVAVIDGSIGYTGGTNLADEYANLYPKRGHWKDTAIRLEGDAVLELTATFLEMWNGDAGTHDDLKDYQPDAQIGATGFFQPFSDGPIHKQEQLAEDMYRAIVSGARDYLYITTPYLVIDGAMADALCMAAASGVDVRIVTPGQWDHWYVHRVTQSNYARLLAAGVRIYEYTPGFIHAKTIISDDEHGITGSINMDYRSFNLHYENGVYLCGAPVLLDIKADLLSLFDKCTEILPGEWRQRPWHRKLSEAVLRLFAVLL